MSYAVCAILLVIPAITSAAVCNSQQCETKVDISEHGARFNEDLSKDEADQTVSVHVPKHHNIEETVTIMSNVTRMQLTYFPDHNFCEFTSIPEEIDPERSFEFFEPINNTLGSDLAAEAKYIRINMGKVSEKDMADLTPKMKNLCRGLEVYRVKLIERTDENTMNGITTVDESELEDSPLRVKRQVQSCPSPLKQQFASVADSDGAWCMYMTCNLASPSARCRHNMVHFQSIPGISTILCCSERRLHVKGKGFCKCSDVSSLTFGSKPFQEKWKSCQKFTGLTSHG